MRRTDYTAEPEVDPRGAPLPPASHADEAIVIKPSACATATQARVAAAFSLLGLPPPQTGVDCSSLSRLRIKTGRYVFHANDTLHYVYVVAVGTLKSLVLDAEGNQQVLGFAMQGDLLGVDGLGSGRYVASAVALEDSEVIAVAPSRLLQWAQLSGEHERAVLHLLTRDLNQQTAHVALMGTLRAPARLARFLSQLSEHLHEQGYSATEIQLRMSRADIASYLGMKLETVSRLLSRLHAQGLIDVQGRYLRLLAPDVLQQMHACKDTLTEVLSPGFKIPSRRVQTHAAVFCPR